MAKSIDQEVHNELSNSLTGFHTNANEYTDPDDFICENDHCSVNYGNSIGNGGYGWHYYLITATAKAIGGATCANTFFQMPMTKWDSIRLDELRTKCEEEYNYKCYYEDIESTGQLNKKVVNIRSWNMMYKGLKFTGPLIYINSFYCDAPVVVCNLKEEEVWIAYRREEALKTFLSGLELFSTDDTLFSIYHSFNYEPPIHYTPNPVNIFPRDMYVFVNHEDECKKYFNVTQNNIKRGEKPLI